MRFLFGERILIKSPFPVTASTLFTVTSDIRALPAMDLISNLHEALRGWHHLARFADDAAGTQQS